MEHLWVLPLPFFVVAEVVEANTVKCSFMADGAFMGPATAILYGGRSSGCRHCEVFITARRQLVFDGSSCAFLKLGKIQKLCHMLNTYTTSSYKSDETRVSICERFCSSVGVVGEPPPRANIIRQLNILLQLAHCVPLHVAALIAYHSAIA
ncbi:hypothetical protein Adt_39702 [Abeliophyllum distichum]|uniref:Secreted protein n=1 Tax=Abeliophyllum distichum TaxID=126358 RepID=A0ABD1QA37_9LAMI